MGLLVHHDEEGNHIPLLRSLLKAIEDVEADEMEGGDDLSDTIGASNSAGPSRTVGSFIGPSVIKEYDKAQRGAYSRAHRPTCKQAAICVDHGLEPASCLRKRKSDGQPKVSGMKAEQHKVFYTIYFKSNTSRNQENARLQLRIEELEEQLGRTEGLCEVLDSGTDFSDSLRSRATWLLGLLVCQSGSSFILENSQTLIQSHPVIVYFMTMLVGAGGNAGNQASVRIIRGLATGEVNPVSEKSFLASEVRMAGGLALILVFAGFLRVVAFDATPVDALAISLSLFLIVGAPRFSNGRSA
ncbi:MAG: hypothetical protein SGPRY_003357 [Prymnesium sp.]